MTKQKLTDKQFKNRIAGRLEFIYSSEPRAELVELIYQAVKQTKEHMPSLPETKWDETDSILITYGDSIKKDGELPLVTLHSFLKKNLSGTLSIVHILPFFPYSSDDGFSVIDYTMVNPELGTWKEIEPIATDFKFMADLVVNHISQHSIWFQNYLKDIDPGKGFFIEVDPDTDLSKVVRPRSLPLLSEVETVNGKKHVWTTFSADQIDVNFGNEQLLVEMVKIFLFYLSQGSSIIRLDAIAFLWKEIGTSCLHLPQTHEVVKLMRDIMDFIHPSMILLTETNVPNKENLSYFGNNDEANMVYQFSLPPLLLHALYTGNAKYLTKWASTIPELPDECTFFNFTASHDGIGVRPLEGLVPDSEFSDLIEGMKAAGAHISTKRNSDGSDSPYEMNITYLDALGKNKDGDSNFAIDRFLCSQTIMMTLQGVPAFYIHSLLGTHNYYDGVKETGMPRSINRRKWNSDDLDAQLTSETDQKTIFDELRRRIAIRKSTSYFHPNTKQQILNISEELFIVVRGDNKELLSISNMTTEEQSIDSSLLHGTYVFDLLSNEKIHNGGDNFFIKPYQTLWLVNK